jgi:cell division protease FtsH
MSERLGPIALGRGDEQVFLGREIVDRAHVSEETSEAIDEEIRRIVEQGRETARKILTEHRDELDSLAMALKERETLDAEDVQALISGAGLPIDSPEAETPEPTDDEASSPSALGDNPKSG